MLYKKLSEACRAWVQEFNAIPGSAIEKIMEFDSSIEEITPPRLYDRISVVYDEYAGERGEVIETNANEEEWLYRIKLDSGEIIEKYINDIEVIEQEGWLPMWGTMWTFGDKIDEEWAEKNLQTVADCGFRIYKSEDFGILIGIDGCGYCFYESHWIPLYKARGLRWHEIDDSIKETA